MGTPRPHLPRLPSTPSLTPFLFSPEPTSTSTTVATLRLHSAYIRDTLLPLLLPITPHLPPQELYLLTTILARISSTRPITLDLLRQSRIVKALQLIVSSTTGGDKPGQGKWPPDSVIQARKILQRWERELGNIYDLRTNFFGNGDPLKGIHPAKQYKITKRSIIFRDEIIDALWTFEHRPDEKVALSNGHLHFTVGDWWLNLASLFRDCGVGHPGLGFMTWDDERTYALVLGAALEKEEPIPLRRSVDDSPLVSNGNSWKVIPWKQASEYDDGTTVRVRIGKSDRGVFKLMRTMAGYDEDKKLVRVFRHVHWGGKYAPSGGVRYDGLYRPCTYSVHLRPPNDWTYVFTLEREVNQPSLSSILHVPISEQMDDWNDFLALEDSGCEETVEPTTVEMNALAPLKGERIRDLVRSKTAMSEVIEAADENDLRDLLSRKLQHKSGKNEGERDSGYFSLNAPLS